MSTPATSSSNTAQPLPASADIPPNQSLYVSNLNEKVGQRELRKALYLVFSQFGNVVEINSHHTYKLRGQAWVIFDTLAGATKAQKDLNGFVFYGKPLRVLFAKNKSDVIAKSQGTFVPRPKRKLQEDIDREKEEKEKERDRKKQKTSSDKPTDKKEKKKKEDSESSSSASTSQPLTADIPAPPNKKLFVENLPNEATDLMLSVLFQQYPGYQSCLVVDVPNKGKVAFIEFQEIFQATAAMDALQAFKVTATHLMKISYAKL